jgi:uncharacterized membrane protein
MNEKRRKLRRIIWIAPLIIVGIILFIFVGGTIVMVLWNWLLPSLFGLPAIGFWQAFGILLLCRILFGGFGMRGSSSESRRRASDRMADRVAERVSQKLEDMTPEERERFRQRVRERWGSEASQTTEL